MGLANTMEKGKFCSYEAKWSDVYEKHCIISSFCGTSLKVYLTRDNHNAEGHGLTKTGILSQGSL
jgi:hypothetical protein